MTDSKPAQDSVSVGWERFGTSAWRASVSTVIGWVALFVVAVSLSCVSKHTRSTAAAVGGFESVKSEVVIFWGRMAHTAAVAEVSRLDGTSSHVVQ